MLRVFNLIVMETRKLDIEVVAESPEEAEMEYRHGDYKTIDELFDHKVTEISEITDGLDLPNKEG